MRLNLARLGIVQKRVGTAGTAGTANVHVGISVPGQFSRMGTEAGTAGTESASVPVFPQAKPAVGTEIANVYGAVPTVPSVPSEKCRNGMRPEPEQSPTLACELQEPLQDHTFWSDDFGKWALRECLFSDRWLTSVKTLHASFCDWCIAQGTVGCMPETFETLLADEGFFIDGALAYALVLKVDVDSLKSHGAQESDN